MTALSDAPWRPEHTITSATIAATATAIRRYPQPKTPM